MAAWFFVAFTWLTYMLGFVTAQTSFGIDDNGFAEKGGDIFLVCELGWTDEPLGPIWNYKLTGTHFYIQRDIKIKKRSTNGNWMEEIAWCVQGEKYFINSLGKSVMYPHYQCFDLYGQKPDRYNITADANNIYIDIPDVERDVDGTDWECYRLKGIYDVNQTKDMSQEMSLTVYTTPTAVSLTTTLQDGHSLSTGPVSLTCQTDTCAYKDPVWKWYIQLADGSCQIFQGGQTSAWDSVQSCSDSERIYYSKLDLDETTSFAGVTSASVQFVCGLLWPTRTEDLLSSPSGRINLGGTALPPTGMLTDSSPCAGGGGGVSGGDGSGSGGGSGGAGQTGSTPTPSSGGGGGSGGASGGGGTAGSTNPTSTTTCGPSIASQFNSPKEVKQLKGKAKFVLLLRLSI